MKQPKWITVTDGDYGFKTYGRKDDWWWAIRTDDLVSACGEKDALAITGNKRFTQQAELLLIPGPTHLSEEDTKKVKECMDLPAYAAPDTIVWACAMYGKAIHIVSEYSSSPKAAVDKIMKRWVKNTNLDWDGPIDSFLSMPVNAMGMTGLEFVNNDMDGAIARLRKANSDEPRTVTKINDPTLGPGTQRKVNDDDVTDECVVVQLWGLDSCNTCDVKDDQCGGWNIRLTKRNSKGVLVPVPDAKGAK